MMYSYEITETGTDGLKESSRVSSTVSARDSQLKCIDFASKGGWTYPKWWQIWRWGDTRPELFEEWKNKYRELVTDEK